MNKILVLDDDKSIRMLYADGLVEEGYEVITSGDGSRFMALIKEKRPDLIVMGARLGRYTSRDLLQGIRKRYYTLPVILCTASPACKQDPGLRAACYPMFEKSDLRELKSIVRTAFENELKFLSSGKHEVVPATKAPPMKQMELFGLKDD